MDNIAYKATSYNQYMRNIFQEIKYHMSNQNILGNDLATVQ